MVVPSSLSCHRCCAQFKIVLYTSFYIYDPEDGDDDLSGLVCIYIHSIRCTYELQAPGNEQSPFVRYQHT